MPIAKTLQVDFSGETLDLTTQGQELLLAQFSQSCKLQQFMAAFTDEAQTLFNAIIALQKGRTLYDAVGANLDAIGAIVGEPRDAYQYSEFDYMFADRSAQGSDSVAVWVTNADMTARMSPTDDIYRERIMFRIMKNRVLCASVPEITTLIKSFYGFNVSFVKSAAYTCSLAVPSYISAPALVNLTRFFDTLKVDHDTWSPYPATLSISDGVIFLPDNWFGTDKMAGHQCDSGLCAVSTDERIVE